MSFFIRVWFNDLEVFFVNSRQHEIEKDMVDLKSATVIDAEISGEYLDAGEVRDALSIMDKELTVAGREVVWQEVSYR